MLNYNNWKKLNESLMSHNLGLKSQNNLGIMMDKHMESYMKSEEDEIEDEVEDEVEDEDEEDEDEDEIEEVDMEDAEDEEGEDEESEDEDEESEDEESEEEDEESEDEESEHEESEDMESKKEDEEGKNCWSKCGYGMASENTMPKHIPSFEDWQKSVSSMLDNSCVTKANFDGIVNEEAALTGAVKQKAAQLAAAVEKQNLGMPQLKTLAHQVIKMLQSELAEKVSDSATKTTLMNNIKLAFKEAASEAETMDNKKMKMNMKMNMKKKMKKK